MLNAITSILARLAERSPELVVVVLAMLILAGLYYADEVKDNEVTRQALDVMKAVLIEANTR